MIPAPLASFSYQGMGSVPDNSEEDHSSVVASEWLLTSERSFRANRTLNYVCVGLVVVSTIGLISLLALSNEGVPIRTAVWLCAAALFAGSAAGVQITHARWRKRCKSMSLFAARADARVVAPLAQAMSMDEYPRHPEWRREIADALSAVLARLQSDDAPRISDTTWARLSGLLQTRYTPEIEALQVSILRAAAMTGALPVMPAAEGLARARPLSQPGDPLREEAAACVSALEEFRERQRRHGALLRPAAAPTTSSEALLRPARGASGSDAALLRPADDPEDTRERSDGA